MLDPSGYGQSIGELIRTQFMLDPSGYEQSIGELIRTQFMLDPSGSPSWKYLLLRPNLDWQSQPSTAMIVSQTLTYT